MSSKSPSVYRHYEVFMAPPKYISDGYREVMAKCMRLPYLKPGVCLRSFPEICAHVSSVYC